jgi:hypothetical protein
MVLCVKIVILLFFQFLSLREKTSLFVFWIIMDKMKRYTKDYIYNLDYLDIGVNIFCDKCKIKKNFLYIPSNEEVIINPYFNSSHNLSGEFLFYFPREWTIINSSDLSDFSLTHKGFIKQLKINHFFHLIIH